MEPPDGILEAASLLSKAKTKVNNSPEETTILTCPYCDLKQVYHCGRKFLPLLMNCLRCGHVSTTYDFKLWEKKKKMGIQQAITIIDEESERSGFKVGEILSKRQFKELSDVRHFIMFRLIAETGLSESDVGRLMNRDRTSVIHGVKKIARKLAT